MRHDPRLIIGGNVGKPAQPAFAFDLARGALIKNAKLAGVTRYGKEDDDSRPLAPSYRLRAITGANAKANYVTVEGNSADLVDIGGTNGGVSYVNAEPNEPAEFSTTGVLTATNQPLSISWFIYEKDKAQLGGLDYFFFDGFLFQIRDGRPEFGELSPAWNEVEDEELTILWALQDPSPTESARIATLVKKLFVSLQSLSFENTTGKSDWIDGLFTISFIPEPRGVVHIVPEGGGDAKPYKVDRIIKTGKKGVLWEAGDVSIGTTGGASFWQFLRPELLLKSTIEYGPLKAPPYANVFDGLTNRISADLGAGSVTLDLVLPDLNYTPLDDGSLEAQLSLLGGGWFGLRATLNSDGINGPWVYGLSARTEQGEFVRDTNPIPVLDTTNLYLPANPGSGESYEAFNPIVDVDIQTERNGERHGTVTVRDVNGNTFKGIGTIQNPGLTSLINRFASCTVVGRDKDGVIKIPSEHLFASALIVGARYTDTRRYAHIAQGQTSPQQLSADVAKGQTRVIFEWMDGWQLLRETKCSPPLINDNLQLGAVCDAILRVTGQSLFTGIGLGPTINGAVLGEAWASTNDANARCADVLSGLMDRYGLGLRIAQDRFGRWNLEKVSTAIAANFTSDGALNDPNLKRTGSGGTRYTLKNPLDWWIDTADYFNVFRLIWGPEGKEQIYVSRIEESIHQPSYVNYLGREKEYEDVIAPDIRTPAAAEYAMRSLKYRHGRFTRFWQSTTYFHRELMPMDRITADGLHCELQSIGGTSLASDEMEIVGGQLP